MSILPNDNLLPVILSVFLTICFGLAEHTRHRKYLTVILACVFILLTAALVYLDSRAGILASIAGILFVLLSNNSTKRKREIWCISCVYILSAVCLYFIRPESAKGRLLIWRVCLNMIFDNPLGYGFNGFQNHYMLYQAAYFMSHRESQLCIYADNVASPFNEYIHVAISYGIWGLSIFLALILNLLLAPKDNGKNDILKSALISVLVFSFFSYPSEIFYTWALFPLSIIFLKKKYLKTLTSLIGIFLLIIGTVTFIRKQNAEVDLNITKPLPQSADNFPILYDLILQFPNMEESYHYRQVVAKACELIPNSDAYCRMGDLLLNEGNAEEAMNYYEIASYMIPYKLRPKYKQFVYYINAHDLKKAYEIGNNILSSPMKVLSSESIIIRNKTKEKMNMLLQLTSTHQ